MPLLILTKVMIVKGTLQMEALFINDSKGIGKSH